MAQPLRKKNTQNDPSLNTTSTQVIYNVAGGPVPNSTFVTLSADPNLTNERILTAGSAISLTDNGAGSSIVVDLADTAVTPGTYTSATLTVDQKGRVTAASSGAAPAAQTTLFNETGANSTLVFIGSKLATDLARRFSATVSGDLAWGDGTAAKVRLNYASGSQLQIVDASNNPADLSLSTLRGNAAIFETPNTFNVSFETRTTGDANPRFQVLGDGKIGLGGGASGLDTYLWRSAIAELSLGSSPTTADGTLRVSTIKTASGNLVLNPAGSAVDFSGKQIINAILPSSGLTFPISYTASTDTDLFLKTNVTGDTYPRFSVTSGGNIAFGAGGSAILPDTYLRRGFNAGEVMISLSENSYMPGTLLASQVGSSSGVTLFGGNINVSGNDITNGRVAQLESIQSPSGKLFLELNPAQTILFGKPFQAGTTSFAATDSVFTVKPNGAANNQVQIKAGGQIGLGPGTVAIQDFIRGIGGTVVFTDTDGSSSPGAANIRTGSIQARLYTSIPGENNIAVNPQGAGPVYQNTNSGCLLLGHTTTWDNCSRVISIGSGRTITGRTQNIVFTASTTTAGSPGVDRSFEALMTGGYWLASNSSNSTGLQIAPGTSTWTTLSDARTKNIYRKLDHKTSATARLQQTNILDALDGFELYEYHYIDADDPENTPKTIGPTTQSFYGSFGEAIGKQPEKRIYTGAFDEDGNCVSKCLKPGDEMELLNERDEKTAMWLVMKALREENIKLRDTLANTIEVVKDLSTRLKLLETAASQTKTKVGTFTKL